MKSHKKYSYLLYWICDYKYLKYIKFYSVNPLCLIFRNVNGYFEEIKYLTLVPTNESNKKDMKNYGIKPEI